MNNQSAQQSPHTAKQVGEPLTPREHSETAAEGSDEADLAEIRMHAQAAAEGPDDDRG